MATLLILLFIVGYVFIALESSFHINKAGTALLTGIGCWVVLTTSTDVSIIHTSLSHHLAEISEILFFLLGAMAIVELIDAHDGFDIITNRITTKNKRQLLWIVSFLAFFLSAILDNLTTAIVMATLVRKLIVDKEDRLYFMGLVIISANAGGAFSPIGDVTTTMLWIANKITPLHIIKTLLLPSIVCAVVPTFIIGLKLKGTIATNNSAASDSITKSSEQLLVFSIGLLVLVLVPVFKAITHLPPYMGVLLGLGLLWIVTELLHKKKDGEEKGRYSVASAISKTDMPSILFFLGILLAIGALQEANILTQLATQLDAIFGNIKVVSLVIGLLSAIVDNVPLVAATIGMYDYPTDHEFWELIAYCTGTGGSCLIIGSAAGVAVMGIENISFSWYLKRIAGLALLGYLSGWGILLLQTIIL